MDDHTKALKECLADIETDLTAQLKIMEESLMSTDFNCCRALYDHQIETMDEMYSGMKKFLSDAVQRKDLDGGGNEDENYPSDEKEEIDPADFPPPVLSMDPRHIGKSILQHEDNPEKNEDEIFRVRFDKVVRKRLFKAPAEEYEYPEIYRLSEKLAFHKALKARNIDIDDLWESEGLLRAEGFALLAGADLSDDETEAENQVTDETMEADEASEEKVEERPPSPKTDDTRELEVMIEKLKQDYQISKKKYEEYKEMLDKNEESAPDPEAVELLKVEVKKQKLMLKTAIQRRNELRNWSEKDLKQRRKDKLARKLLESHKKPKRIETEKPIDYMSSSSSDSSAPGSVKSNASFLNSDSSELSPISEVSKSSSDDEKQDSGEQQIGSHESITEREGDFSMPEDESSLQQPPSSTTKESGNEEEDVEMGET
uniref:Uncharacterized protein n=1 Tax=Panagrolaimus davidi TaxID=227884 RepID=A0A914QUS2_9BILA